MVANTEKDDLYNEYEKILQNTIFNSAEEFFEKRSQKQLKSRRDHSSENLEQEEDTVIQETMEVKL